MCLIFPFKSLYFQNFFFGRVIVNLVNFVRLIGRLFSLFSLSLLSPCLFPLSQLPTPGPSYFFLALLCAVSTLLVPYILAMAFLFGKRKTPREILRENQRMIRRSQREIDRERTALQRQEKQITVEIKKMAKQNQMVWWCH